MRVIRKFAATLVAMGAIACLAPLPITSAAVPEGWNFVPRQDPHALSVLTYNVEGLPFPAAIGRSAVMPEIAGKLADLRRRHAEPDVVLLQEAFVPKAKAIAREAGYRYVAFGPAPEDAAAGHDVGARSWLKGETEGKWIDSGLVIMSDYPIVSTRRYAFPEGMCAGYDCLASKGVLVARIALPGVKQPVAIVDTHLNSRAASGTDPRHANAAYAAQIGAARAFVASAVPLGEPVVFGGDFNIGHDPARVADAGAGGGMVVEGTEATTLASLDATPTLEARRALEAILQRAKDKQYFRSGTEVPLHFASLSVPFGGPGQALSDHVDYMVRYSLK